MSVSAVIMVDQKNGPQIRESGTLALAGQRMVFTSDARKIEMSVHGCSIALGGAANRHAFIGHPSHPEATIDITDFSFFREPAFKGHPQAAQFTAQKNKHKTAHFLSYAFVWMLVLVPFYLVFFQRDMLVNIAVDRIPPALDIKLGDLMYGEDGDEVITDRAANDAVARMVAPIIKAAQTDPAAAPFTYRIHIIKSDEVNAYALPGGHILLHTGLIAKTQTPEELLGVLAHEIGHVNGRHSMKQIVHSLSTWAFLMFLGADPNHVVMMLGDQAKTLAARGFTRAHEHEADRLSYDYMKAAGYDPQGISAFFARLKEEEDKSVLTRAANNRFTALLSTHPLTDDRMAAIAAMGAQDAHSPAQKSPLAGFDYNAFKAYVAELVAQDGAAQDGTTQDGATQGDADTDTNSTTKDAAE